MKYDKSEQGRREEGGWGRSVRISGSLDVCDVGAVRLDRREEAGREVAEGGGQ